LKVGATVQIGLDKPVKLCEVFKRYVEFCFEQYPMTKVDISELEFFHTQLLSGQDTAEGAALMKNDRISVRRERVKERLDEEAANRAQRESDQPYFRQLRDMLPDAQDSSTPIHDVADVILDCRQSLNPNTVSTIKCHSVMIRKRCPWLNRMIAAARQEMARLSVVTLPDLKAVDDNGDPTAAKIENDDEDINEASSTSVVERQKLPESKFLLVEIKDHAPEVIKILLEYCYTNRVESLGSEAFKLSCKTTPQYKKGPVPPFSQRQWPNHGEPVVTFDVAVAGVRLAEEANLPRLSLMCEIAAAQLVDHAHAVDALEVCEKQNQLTGNMLPRLRKATMEVVLMSCRFGDDNYTTNMIKNGLAKKSAMLIPTLITGTMEAIEAREKRMRRFNTGATLSLDKQDWQANARRHYDKIDQMDSMERDRERRKRRAGNAFHDDYLGRYMQGVAGGGTILDDDEMFSFWGESELKRKTLKRMHGPRSVLSFCERLVPRKNGMLGNHLVVPSKRSNPTQAMPRRDLR
jgi:hypothetical protein